MPLYDYAIDGDDVLTSLGDEWLRFARENGAPGLSRETVLGRCLWEYVAGEPTREMYQAIFRRVREEGKLVELPFRCDSPDRFRFMQLVIYAGEGRELRLSGRLVREQARPLLPLLDRLVVRSKDPLPICSVCLRVRILGTEWVEAEEAAKRLDLFASAELPPLDYRVCPDCVALAAGSGRS